MNVNIGLISYRLYKELGPGIRESLAKISVEQLEKTGRPFRVAVDISIWQFQVQLGKGGKNPALRTLYYRLLRFLALSIHPLFVFDGPNKPPFKRNVKTSHHGPSLPNMLAKELLKKFGFPYLTAPGEAEAECALLQRKGIVDAVLSEDVDTLMFGCDMHMRNWSREGKGNIPTHVNVYHSKNIKKEKSLDREGMVLVALMSGGDYIPAGIPNCGPKTACEAARAGFGNGLCKLAADDNVGMRQWRERLEYELHTNESGYFRQKSGKLKVPVNFPDKKVLRYYNDPTVSSAEKVSDLRKSIQWECPVDVERLREFVADAFEWQILGGAYKFIRGLAPALLVQKLRLRAVETVLSDNMDKSAEEECKLIRRIVDKPRTHFGTGGVTELRVIYVPAEIVGLDLDKEESGEYAGIVDSEAEEDAPGSNDDKTSRCVSPTKKRDTSKYDPTTPEKIWILETVAKLGIPLTVENWEAEMRNTKAFASRKARERAALAPKTLRRGPMDAFASVTKPGIRRNEDKILDSDRTVKQDTFALSTQVNTAKDTIANHKFNTQNRQNMMDNVKVRPIAKKGANKAESYSRRLQLPDSSPQEITVNPWTLSRRPSDTLEVNTARMKRYSALGINISPATLKPRSGDDYNQPLITDSPLSAKTTPSKAVSSKKAFRSARHNSPKRPLSDSSQEKSFSHQASTNLEIKGRPISDKLVCPTSSSPVIISSSPPSLPELLSEPSRNARAGPRKNRDKSGSPVTSSVPKVAPERFILRKSLVGTWKDMQPWEADPATPDRVIYGVETVDLTGSS